MKKEEKIRRAFEFLVNCAQNNKSFTLEELSHASGWTIGNTETNISKRISELVTCKNKAYNVRSEIFQVRFKDFLDLFRQKQYLFADYYLIKSQSVLVYEFFMPLSCEDRLRESLDNLFYKDTIEQRINEIGIARIKETLKVDNTFSDDQVKQKVIFLLENYIGGYSLYLVNGRFRNGLLITRQEASSRPYSQGRYLIDETTAVVRFIIPIGVEEKIDSQLSLFEPSHPESTTLEIAEIVRWIFLNFFAEAVTRVVRKEDEIWLLESGMKNGLYRWINKQK